MMFELQSLLEVIKSGDYLVLDTETTGLGAEAEICQIAIIDSSGKVLLDTLVKPVRPIPPEATKIHGITNDDVKDAKPFPFLFVSQLLKGQNVIIYNSDYDVRLMYQATDILDTKSEEWRESDWRNNSFFYCAMTAFAEIYGDWNDYRKNYRWQRLETACNYYKVKATEAHTALGDCLSTLAVCKAMVERVTNDTL